MRIKRKHILWPMLVVYLVTLAICGVRISDGEHRRLLEEKRLFLKEHCQCKEIKQ